MSDRHGMPVWYELMTRDADAAQDFYARVLGWTITPTPTAAGAPEYRVCAAPGGAAVAGLMVPPEGGPAARWFFYVAVDDVDAAVAQAQAAGGAVHMPPFEVPGVGRLAFLADPQGALFYLMRRSDDAPSQAFLPSDRALPGHAVWNELTTPDQDAATAFYGALFGWREQGAMPMGPLGEYRFVVHGDDPLGASMPSMPQAPDGWQVYFHVEDVDAALARLDAAGGAVLQGPDQIPGGQYSVVAQDPQGARFGFVGARAEAAA